MTDFAELADRVEGLMGPDREIDLAIYRLCMPDERLDTIIANRRGLDGNEGTAWDIVRESVIYETRNDRGDCWANGGIPIPAYTASLDAAMTLSPDGDGVGITTARGPWVGGNCRIWEINTDAKIEWEVGGDANSLALAICAAALRARA